MKVAFLFPGQGSQKVGMGADLAREFPAALRVFQEADEALGMSLSRLCFEGPEENLRLTANTQPATLATSIAAVRARGRLMQEACPPGQGAMAALIGLGLPAVQE